MKTNDHADFVKHLIKTGIRIFDPQRIDFRPKNQINNFKENFIFRKGVEIDINSIFIGRVKIGKNSKIGANCIIEDCEIDEDIEIQPFSYLVGARIKKGAKIGPYARIRPGTIIEANAHVGNFVEIKNSKIGKQSKANHLSYLGDSIIGQKVNIGAGTITCNYDGVNKHQTIIKDEVFIGSNSQLIAPVTIGKGATIGAGTTLNKNAPSGKLTLSRAKQATISKWQRPKKKS